MRVSAPGNLSNFLAACVKSPQVPTSIACIGSIFSPMYAHYSHRRCDLDSRSMGLPLYRNTRFASNRRTLASSCSITPIYGVLETYLPCLVLVSSDLSKMKPRARSTLSHVDGMISPKRCAR